MARSTQYVQMARLANLGAKVEALVKGKPKSATPVKRRKRKKDEKKVSRPKDRPVVKDQDDEEEE